ncbi:MAG: gliding motility-associated C-terminal domain-containing protein [Chitinophagaceae bacterium]|nr:gliding motility-associated C-terminal domain-containing protein [Chitinophagaceae bacterium]
MKLFLKSGLACLIAMLFFTQAQATHSAGIDLSYVLVPGTTNTYEFTLRFYRDCGATGQTTSTEPASFTLCYTSPCTGTIQNITMPKIVGNIPTIPPQPNGSVLNNGCNAVTTCTNPSSVTHGYRQWWYRGQVTLPVTCNSWRFWSNLCCRNDLTLNIGPNLPGSYDIYVECTFDNTVSQNNGSPFFIYSNSPSTLPVPYNCVNTPYQHNGGAQDPNGDSLVFETIYPRDFAGCTAGIPTTILSTAGVPPFNILNTNGNPFQTNNTFNVDQATGYFDYTPSQVGYWVMCQKVSEYRNGQLIGTAMRDMQIVVDNCNPLPIISGLDSLSVTGGTSNGDTVFVCPDQALHFCFDIIDQVNPAAYVQHVFDNHNQTMPGSTLTWTKPTTNSLNVCIDWTPTLADSGLHILFVNVTDSLDCLVSPNFANIPIFVRHDLKAWGDTSICLGQNAQLGCYGNGNYTWTALPGGSGTGSLSCTNCNNPVASPTVTTSYVASDGYCNYKDTVTITMAYGPALIITPDTTTCVNATLQLDVSSTAPGTYTYLWSPSTGLSSTTIPNPVASGLSSSLTYTVVVTPSGPGQLPCPSQENVVVNVLNGFDVNPKDSYICDGSSVNITGTGSNQYIYNWIPSTFVSNPTINNPVITPSPLGVYNYQVIASYPGCPDSVLYVKIEVEPIPEVHAGPDRVICNHDTVLMNAVVYPFGPNYTYLWTPGTDLTSATTLNPSFYGSTAFTSYILSATTPHGCTSQDTVNIAVNSTDYLLMGKDQTMCPHEVVTLSALGGVNYHWNPAYLVSDSTAGIVTTSPAVTTTFYVTALDQNGCKDTNNITVYVYPGGELYAGDDVTIYPGESTQLNAEGNCAFYTWFPPNGLSNPNIKNPIAQPSVTTQYIVNGSTEYGCKIQDTVVVNVSPESLLELPNAFTPGPGTSINDILGIKVRGTVKLNSFRIFNRWGQEVFSTTNINEGWNGQYNGKLQPMGTYVYMIDATTSTGKRFTKQGNVTLVR